MMDERKILENKIRNIDKQIALLQKLKAQCQEKLKGSQLETQAVSLTDDVENTNHDRASIFQSYFRGRDNVYARLWINQRTHRKGYSPACKNEWVRALCRKPQVKCSECPNQSFFPFDNTAIERHLGGKDVIGMYPMTEDEKCFFIAFDFDKDSWLTDINALRDICESEGIDLRVERSRSGKGGHGWIFFEEEVPVFLARQLGTYLITKTMSNRLELDMKSYDRLFPNQDTLPKGGFGNLIALPFQREAMLRSNSVFIDKDGNAYDNQWGYLSKTKKVSFEQLREIVDAGLANRSIMEVRFTATENDAEDPWLRLPSGKKRFKTEIKNLPKKMEAVEKRCHLLIYLSSIDRDPPTNYWLITLQQNYKSIKLNTTYYLEKLLTFPPKTVPLVIRFGTC
jgi:hypothetical protein